MDIIARKENKNNSKKGNDEDDSLDLEVAGTERTSETKEVKWSSVKDTLDLFCHKNWDYLWKADYMFPPDKMELRQEAIAQGLIG